MLNPYSILACFALFVLSTAGAYVSGRRDGQRIEQGKCLAQAAAVAEASRIVDERIAKGLAEQEVKQVTIRQQTERIIEKVPVVTECDAGDRMRAVSDAALAGTAPPGDSELPAANPDAG
jgi:hypothetical protein